MNGKPLVGIVMGSKSDWPTMEHCSKTLDELGVPHEVKVMSAHRTPGVVQQYIGGAEDAGLEVIIAAAGGAAHLAGVCAAHTALPVLGVPMETGCAGGIDSLLSTVQMPGGVPVGTLAIGKAGAKNAAILATQILGGKHEQFRQAVKTFREKQTAKVGAGEDPRKG